MAFRPESSGSTYLWSSEDVDAKRKIIRRPVVNCIPVAGAGPALVRDAVDNVFLV